MCRRCLTGWLSAFLVGAGLLAAAAAPAAPPTFERIDVDDTFADEFLSEECGVPVTTSVSGHVTLRTFSGDKPAVTLNTLNLTFTATAGDRSVQFHDVGNDLLKQMPDGTLVLQIVGQVPFEFAGALKIDPETEEVFLEPHDRSAKQIARVCAALTG